MPIDAEELEGRFYALRDEIGVRLTPLEEEAHYANTRTDTIADAVTSLKEEFEEFKALLINDFNTLVDKLQSCARASDLVDENGGPLDEYLESFKRH